MFVTKNQFFVFVACVAIGAVCGLFFTVAAAVKRGIKNCYLRIIPDFIAFLPTTALYLFVSYKLKFPNFRAYMVLGTFTGIFAYMKTYRVLLAKCGKKAYNLLRKTKRKRKR